MGEGSAGPVASAQNAPPVPRVEGHQIPPPVRLREPDAAALSESGVFQASKDPAGEGRVLGGIPFSQAREDGTVRIAASKLDRLITGSENLLTTRLFITHRLQELESIPERSLPRSVQERYRWASGDLDGAEVLPMRRRPGR